MINQMKSAYIINGKHFRLLRKMRAVWRTLAMNDVDMRHMGSKLLDLVSDGNHGRKGG